MDDEDIANLKHALLVVQELIPERGLVIVACGRDAQAISNMPESEMIRALNHVVDTRRKVTKGQH